VRIFSPGSTSALIQRSTVSLTPEVTKNILHRRNAFAYRLTTNGIESFSNARRRRISVLAVAHGFVNGVDNVRRSLEIKVERVADIQGQNFVSLLDDLVSDTRQVANGVADVVETFGCADFAGLAMA